MEGLLNLLLFAGLFYLMMRLGCGAHMIHGHGEEAHGHGEEAVNHQDPVCGMQVDPKQGYGKMYGDRLYRFCSRNCLDKFDADPEAFIGKTEESHE
jgi:YHS domain-containing protein